MDKEATCISHDGTALSKLEGFCKHSDIDQYLRLCLPLVCYGASGLDVLNLEAILEENEEEVTPGGYINPAGFLVVATSIGGNAVCFDVNTGNVYWADHGRFSEVRILSVDSKTGEMECYETLPENVIKGMVLLDTSIENFLCELLQDKLEDELEELDMN